MYSYFYYSEIFLPKHLYRGLEPIDFSVVFSMIRGAFGLTPVWKKL